MERGCYTPPEGSCGALADEMLRVRSSVQPEKLIVKVSSKTVSS